VAGTGSKNNPDNRTGPTNADKWVEVREVGKKRRFCRVVEGDKLVDRDGNAVGAY